MQITWRNGSASETIIALGWVDCEKSPKGKITLIYADGSGIFVFRIGYVKTDGVGAEKVFCRSSGLSMSEFGGNSAVCFYIKSIAVS